MEIIFSFDTEDYVDPVSNDALLSLAQIHSRHGVPATFGLVGEKARFIHFCGRDDVVRALADHEVAYHSDHHFILPNRRYEPRHTPAWVAQRTWDEGVDRLLAEESRGLADIEAIFGARPVTQLRNYGDWAPQVMVAQARLGVGVHAYGPIFHNQDPEPIWYCNQLQIANPRHMYENYLHDFTLSPQEKLQRHIADLRRHLEAGTPRLGWVTHPTRFITDIWWEYPNWWGHCDDPPRDRWRIPARFSPERIAELLSIADGVVGFAAQTGEIVPRTFRDFWEEYRPRRAWVTCAEIGRLARLVRERPAAVLLEGESFSPAELLGIFAHALGAPEGGAAAERSPLRRIIGPTDEPHATKPGEASRETIVEAAQIAEYFIRDHARVPARVRVGGTQLGPGALLVAMAAVLRDPETDRIAISDTPNLPDEHQPGHYETIDRGDWAMGYIQYQDRRDEVDQSSIRRHAALQYWTLKPATRTS